MLGSSVSRLRPGAALLPVIAILVVVALLPGEGRTDPAGHSAVGADTCLKCHDETASPTVHAIFSSPHGIVDDPRTPLAQQQCESCHGPGADHTGRVRFGQVRPPTPAFATGATETLGEQNQRCLACHGHREIPHWQGSAHQRDELLCSQCHTLHARRDPVLDRSGQARVCFDCHRAVQTASHFRSNHFLREGKLACSDCHQPHGSQNKAMLSAPTMNQQCYQCHAAKRGPFLWEHAPASEDCGLCHRPHGSNHPALLKKRPPLLCQQCHSRAGHPGRALTGNNLPGRSPSAFLLGGSCLNCHSQVHGSNHPSGANLSR